MAALSYDGHESSPVPALSRCLRIRRPWRNDTSLLVLAISFAGLIAYRTSWAQRISVTYDSFISPELHHATDKTVANKLHQSHPGKQLLRADVNSFDCVDAEFPISVGFQTKSSKYSSTEVQKYILRTRVLLCRTFSVERSSWLLKQEAQLPLRNRASAMYFL